MASGAGDGLYERTIQNSEKYVQEYAASRGKVSPEVIVYRYGMKLDIAKLIYTSSTNFGCEVMPAQMTYEKSNGDLETVEYQVLGTSCLNQN